MSGKHYRAMIEDRSLRNSALALLKADISHLRADLAGKSIGERILDRASEGAVDVFEEAADVASNNRGILATLVAAIFIWFARNPVMSLFTDDEDEPDDGDYADDNDTD